MLFNLLCSAWWFLLMWQMIVPLLLQIWSASCTLRKTSRSLLYKEILSASSIRTFPGILLLSTFTHAVFFNWKGARSVPCRGLGSIPEGVCAMQIFAWVGWLVCKVLVRLMFGAALVQVRELAVSHATSLLCLHSDLEGPFSWGCCNLGLAADSDNRGAN